MWNKKKAQLNKDIYKVMSCCLFFASLENSILASESFSSTMAIEKNMTVANSTHDCGSVVVNDAKETRYSRYNYISQHLEKLNDESISALLEQGTSLHSGWGTSVKLEIDGVPIFVKKVPLNEIEGKPENIRSTENLFGIPPYYQYGVGSGGFSVWRELSAHILSTEWVLSSENGNLPLMYHWRIINNSDEKAPLDEEELKNYVKYWDDSSAIGERVRANHDASAYVALFIEYIPDTLDTWLNKQLSKGDGSIDKAIEMVERNLNETIAFINSKGMLHFDAHFHNILTDGEHLFFSDFGLATSSQFSLSQEEMQFFQNHQNYDRCYVVMTLTDWIISRLFGKDRCDEVLQEYAEGKTPLLLPSALTPYLSSIVKRYAPITLKMNKFFEALREKTKQDPYPANELDQLLIEAGLTF
jgi:hypothetical protein